MCFQHVKVETVKSRQHKPIRYGVEINLICFDVQKYGLQRDGSGLWEIPFFVFLPKVR